MLASLLRIAERSPETGIAGAVAPNILALQERFGNRYVQEIMRGAAPERAPPGERSPLQRFEEGEHIKFGEIESLIGPEEKEYEVQKGESLAGIAAKFQVTVEDIKKRNSLQLQEPVGDPNVAAGDKIIIPTGNLAVISPQNPPKKDKAKTFSINGVDFSYGQVIALGDHFRDFKEMQQATRARLTALKTMLIKEEKKSGSATDKEKQEASGGRYFEIAAENQSHFAPPDPQIIRSKTPATGVNHKTEWEKHHKAALETAQAGNRDEALAINAMGDHFLTDAFSAGHLFNKEDMIAKFDNRLQGMEADFFDAVAKEVWKDKKSRDLISSYETAERIYLHHPNIDDAGRFSKVLKGIYKEEKATILNTLPKLVHDSLGRMGVEVENAKKDKWKLPGDGHLDDTTLEIAKKAVAQSQVNVLNAIGKKTPLDLANLQQEVWSYVPRPTVRGTHMIRGTTSFLTDPTGGMLIATAKLIQSHLETIMGKLVERKKLRKA